MRWMKRFGVSGLCHAPQMKKRCAWLLSDQIRKELPHHKAPMFTLIDNGDLYGPEPLGRQALLMVGEAIARIGSVGRADLQNWANVEFVDAVDCFVIPGFIDPHEHILGGSGENGFSSQTPEISLSEIVTAGITT